MKLHFLLLTTLVSSCLAQSPEIEELTSAIRDAFSALEARVDNLQGNFGNLARQVMLQQFNSEQRVRTDGQSGVKAVRAGFHGPKNYYGVNHISRTFISIHDHSDHHATVGLGEINAVINGVEFRTRHNDYKLVMPSTTSREYHAIEPLPQPEVPPSVLELDDVNDQIAEMRTYFQAFATQNTTLRDYRPYFPAVLCYMEGAWTKAEEKIDEPFSSDRHQIDAESWLELQSKVRYGAYTGTKSALENFAHLPTTIMHVNKTTDEPMFAQWNYRIVCSPLKEELPFKHIKQIDDLSYSYPRGRVFEDNRIKRAARFILWDHEKPEHERYGLMDRIFYDIAGKDNFPSNLTQESYGNPLYMPGTKVPQDTSRYTRSTELGAADAMGNTFVKRGFNDNNMWCAETTQPRVAPIIIERCQRIQVEGRRGRVKVCEDIETRFSWAIPLEIIYLTPLHNWNPYNIQYQDAKHAATNGGTLTGREAAKALNGSDRTRFYRTPAEFFTGNVISDDPADTEAKGGVWVSDAEGVPRKCSGSGPRIITPDIEGVGRVRLRYPVAPVHGEGGAAWMELNALKDLVLEQADEASDKALIIDFKMSTTFKTPPGEHTHEFTLSAHDFKKIRDEGQRRTVTTSLDQGHFHELVVMYRMGRFEYASCSGRRICKDGHPKLLIPDETDVAHIAD